MEESVNNSPILRKIWIRWAIVALVLLVAAISLTNFYQIKTLESQFAETKTKFEKWVPTFERWGKVIPSLAPTIFTEPTTGKQEPLEIVGIIQRSEVEGGCWYIQPDFPECKGATCPLGLPANYEPINLPKELQKAGLKAKFKLEVQSGVATICQLGPAVKILEYQIVK